VCLRAKDVDSFGQASILPKSPADRKRVVSGC